MKSNPPVLRTPRQAAAQAILAVGRAQHAVPAAPAQVVAVDFRRPIAALPLAALFAGLACAIVTAQLLPAPAIATARLGLTPGTAAAAMPSALAALGTGTVMVRSHALLADVVADQDLARNPAFAAAPQDSLSLLMELLAGTGGASTDAQARAESRLAQALQTSFEPETATLSLSVAAADPELAAQLANGLSSALAARINGGSPVAARSVTPTGHGGSLAEAEGALAAFKAKLTPSRIVTAGQQQRALDSLTREQAALARTVAAAKERRQQLRSIDLTKAIDGMLPPDLGATPLEDMRAKYIGAKVTVDRLAVNLGPRHPQRLAAEAELTGLKTGLQTAIRRLQTDSEQTLQAGLKRQAALTQDVAALTRTLQQSGVDLARLDSLQAARDLALDSITTASTGSSAASQRQSLPIVEIVTPATAAAASTGPAMAPAAAAGLFGGLLVLLGGWVVRSRRQHRATAPDERHPLPATLHQPYEPPDPVSAFVERPVDHPVSWAAPHNPVFASANDDRPVAAAPSYGATAGPQPPLRPSPLLEELRRVAPHVFREAPADPHIRALRLEMAAIKERVRDWSESRAQGRF